MQCLYMSLLSYAEAKIGDFECFTTAPPGDNLASADES